MSVCGCSDLLFCVVLVLFCCCLLLDCFVCVDCLVGCLVCAWFCLGLVLTVCCLLVVYVFAISFGCLLVSFVLLVVLLLVFVL